jgi:hypothetical protein
MVPGFVKRVFKRLQHEWVVDKDKVFTLTLDHECPYGALINRSYIYQNNYWALGGLVLSGADERGVERVRFCIVPGRKLKSRGGFVQRDRAEKKLGKRGMRFPKPREMLLALAEDYKIGRECQLVMFVDQDPPYVCWVNDHITGGRYFNRSPSPNDDQWSLEYNYLAVYK